MTSILFGRVQPLRHREHRHQDALQASRASESPSSSRVGAPCARRSMRQVLTSTTLLYRDGWATG